MHPQKYTYTISEKNIGIAQISTASILRGTQGAFVKLIETNPIGLIFFRGVLALGIMLIYMFFVKKLISYKVLVSKKTYGVHFASCLNILRMALLFTGISLAPLSSGVIVLSTFSIWTAFLEPFFFNKKIAVHNVLFSMIAFIGICFVLLGEPPSTENSTLIGHMILLTAAPVTALWTIIWKKHSKNLSVEETLFHHNFLPVVVLVPVLFFVPIPSLGEWFWILIFALLIGIGTFALWISALKKIRASSFTVMQYLEPLSAVAIGIVLLGENINQNIIFGAVLIIISIVFVGGNEQNK